jgi:hypothetical protein
MLNPAGETSLEHMADEIARNFGCLLEQLLERVRQLPD